MDESLFLNLVSTALFHPDICYQNTLDNEEWEQLFVEGKNHSLLALLYPVVYSNCSLPDYVKFAWKENAIFTQTRWLQMMKAQADFLNLLKLNGIDVAVIKGASAAIFYIHPYQRLSGDVDVIVKYEDYDKAYNILLNNGYIAKGELSYHRELVKNDVEFELHYTIPKLPNSKKGKYTYKLIQDGVSSNIETSIVNFKMFMLPSLQNGIVLLRHILQHMVKGIGLRQIIDWMMYVNSNLNDTNWSKIKTEYNKCGLTKTAIIITKMCQKYLGLRSDDITWCNNADDAVVDSLMKYVLAQGDLGRKSLKAEEKGINVFTRDKGVLNFFKRLQNHGVANWEACKKYPILKPFAWFNTIIRYSKYVTSREHARNQLFDDICVSRERKKLYKDIGCFDSKLYDQKEIMR